MKNAIITGASTGIGQLTAMAFAKEGYKVFLVARSELKLKMVANQITTDKGEAEIIIADLSNINSVNSLIEKIKSQVNKIDVIANIAGIWHSDNEVFANIDFKDFNQKVILDTYTVGLIAPTLMVHGLLPLMAKGSKIINLSGTFENGAKGWLPYFVSKRAIEDLTIGLSQELEGNGIQVNCVPPSDTATESYAKYFSQYINEAIAPAEIAKKIVELCDEENKTTGKVIVMKKDKESFEAFHA